MKNWNLPSVAATAILACVGIAAPAQATPVNLLQNGSFETGDFTGWTTSGNFEDTEVVSGPFFIYSAAEDGNQYTVAGPIGSDGGLSQTFSDVHGQTLQITGWYSAEGDNPSDLSVIFDGKTLLDLTNPTTGGAWTEFSFDVKATGSDTFALTFRDDPAFIALDNFSITPVAAVPEPASLALLGSGLVAAAGAIRRRKRGAKA